MSEDLKSRLHFGDRGLNTAAASKLYSQIVSQKDKILKNDLITSSSPQQIAELKLVWEQCTVQSSSVCLACSDCLVSLVQHGHAELSYIMKGLLNVIPSAVNTTGVIQALGKLLLLQIQASVTSEGMYHSPNGLRSPPHPFISVLTSRPDCWPSVLHQVSHLLTDDRYSRYTVRMLHPFLAYTMLNPAIPYQLATFKTLLTHTLLQICQSSVSTSRHDSVAMELFAFVIDCLHQAKVTSLPELTEATSHLTTIVQVAQSLPSTDKRTYKSLSVLGVTLCKDCLTHGHDMMASLKVLEQTIDLCGVDVVDETLICSLSCLMLETPGNQLGGLLSVVRKVVSVCEEVAPMLNSCIQLIILPLLQIISVPVNVMGTNQRSANQTAASKLLSVVRRLSHNGLKQRPMLQHQTQSKNAWYQLMRYCSHLSCTVMEDTNAAYDWLVSVQWNISHSDSVSNIVMLLVTSLLWGREQRVVRAALNVLIQIANRDNRWAPSLLPLLLYRLGEEHDSTLTFDLLTAIPHTVTHKVCMTSVLKTLQSLSAGDENMYPLVMRLITQLWKIQDRSFPHLQKLLSKPLSDSQCSDSNTKNELLLAKAASIRDVCIQRPDHGADLLPVLSKLLADCSHQTQASIAALALDALDSLCQAGVVDLRTMWDVLESKLSKDNRPMVLKSVCKLLGSAPMVATETHDYEEFCESVLELLWQHSNHSNPIVSSAAFTALANFSEEDFCLDDLPLQVTEEARAKMASSQAKQKEEASSSIEDEEEGEDVPPSCYINLLLHVNHEVLPAYKTFMSSLLDEELKNMPRGLYKSTMQRKQLQPTNQSKVFDNIPSALLNRFERTKQPGLKQGLAVGLLCCFEPKRDTSHRDNKPAVRHLVSNGRAYQHMITTLMNQVSVEPSDWLKWMQLPHGWTSLMHKAFHSLIKSRSADLEIQQSLGHTNENPADRQAKMNSAWLWARDKLTEQLKTAAKSDSTLAQSNSILVLASLALVSTQHYLSLDDEDKSGKGYQPSHTGHNQWLRMVLDTLLCVLDCDYQAKGQIFTWYQQQPGLPSLSPRVYSNAAVGLSNLTPLLLTTDTQILLYIMDLLSNGLPRQPKAHSSHDVQMHHGIAVGMMMVRLHEAHYADYMGAEGEVLMIRVLDALEEASLNKEDASCGALLGLALALSAMSREGATHIKAHVANMHHRLVTRLEEEDLDSKYLEALCLCIACLTPACFYNNIISPNETFNAAVKLQTLCQQHDKNAGLAVCCGLMYHSLVCSSHPTVGPLVKNVFSTWSSTLDSQTSTVSDKVACLHGLTALVTGSGLLVQNAADTQLPPDLHNKRVAVVKHVNQMLSDWSDPALQNTATWMLGYIHLVSGSVSQNQTGVASTYSYLPETSILRVCIDQLVQASKMQLEVMSAGRLETLLSVLVARPPLPPLNWTSLLSPILRLPYGVKVHCLCLELAVSQSQHQSTAALCLATWLTPTLFTTLKESCKAVLYSSLPTLIKALPSSKLKPFIETCLLEPFRVCGVHTVHQCQVILDGLLGALQITDPPQGAVSLLYQAVRNVYNLVPAAIQVIHGSILAKLAQCLCHLPGEDIDSVTSALERDNLVKSTFVRSYLVCHGKQSLMWLNACIDVGMNLSNDADHHSIVWILLVSFTQCDSTAQHTSPIQRLHWLLELMGHASNVAHGKTQLAPNRSIAKAVQFLLDVFTAAIIAWSPTDLVLLLGITPSWFPAHPPNHTGLPVIRATDIENEASYGVSTSLVGSGKMEHRVVEDLLQFLPYSLPQLLKTQLWSQITDKMLDWLLGMHEVQGEVLSVKTKNYLKGSLYSLRHTPAFKKSACWTRVHST